jgi:hypothetical protein
MPNDTDHQSLAWVRAGFADAAVDGAFDSFGWWLTGGVSLLVWTGLALLLTSA